MAKRESKPSAQNVTEYVLHRALRSGGSQGVFSHLSESAVRAVHARCVADDAGNGRVSEYSLIQRVVEADGDVNENEVTL